MEPLIFAEFSPSTKESWKSRAMAELGGKSPDDNWNLADTLSIEPYYTSTEVNPEEMAAIQEAQQKSTGWLNTPSISFGSTLETNQQIRTALASGADAILLDLSNKPLQECELDKLLHAIRLDESYLYVATDRNPLALYNEITKVAGHYLKGGIAYDPLAQWIRTGNDLPTSLEQIAAVVHQAEMMKDFRPLMVESHVYHQAGANPVQELAAMIATLVHCTDFFTDAGISPLRALNCSFFSVSIGPEYLSEIAKLRALRLLYRKVTRAYQLPDAHCHAFIHARTSLFYHSEMAPTTNLVRVTSEAMSAVVGGCDALTVNEYRSTDEHAGRVAQNVSLLMAEEAKMKQVADPAAGSYLIENMTLQLADAAWNLFLQMEDAGGIVNSYNNGFLPSEIEKARAQKTGQPPQGKTMVGVNKFSEREACTDDAARQDVPAIKPGRPSPLPQQTLETYLRSDS
jgi:methylmalonyl-CoA mutase